VRNEEHGTMTEEIKIGKKSKSAGVMNGSKSKGK